MSSRDAMPSRWGAILAGVVFSTACGDPFAGLPASDDDSSPPGTTASALSHFEQRVQPRLNFCRSCHISGGVADVEDGRRFQLSSAGFDDFAQVNAAWIALGRGVDENDLVRKPGVLAEPHTGGKPWPEGSEAYEDIRTLLWCFESPAECVVGEGGLVGSELPLLGSSHGTHRWESACAGQSDQALLPPDPRTLVRPGANADRAVFYNAFWENCHVNLPEADGPPRTCGEYRQRRDRGRFFMLDELPRGAISAQTFNDTWKSWGLSERPADFDEMYTLRYGLNWATYPNPYPLPGEDPNQTNGGSGQLPLGLRQVKDTDGRWTGDVASAACLLCHGGQIGDPRVGEELATLANLGAGNNNYDVLMSSRDSSALAGSGLEALLPAFDESTAFNLGVKQRGHNNAVGAFLILNTILDLDSLGVNPNPGKALIAAGSPEDLTLPIAEPQDTPAWWNVSHRPRKFFDGGVSIDSTRILMAAGPGELEDLFTFDGIPYRSRIEEWDQDVAAFLTSLTSPAYPGPIDTALAEQGAILFHSKDLWAAPGNAGRPRPLGGNGSCASCHGAYSPRFVNDPTFLEDPALEGVAAHIVPLEVIGTDSLRVEMLSPSLRSGWGNTYWGYPDGVPGWVAPEDKDPVTEMLDDMSPFRPQGVCGWEMGVIGYQAPPLYGVWATAPYFHNGSVPTVEQVLDPSARPTIWQRELKTVGSVTGFEQGLVAYDFERVGWRHDVLTCDEIPGTTSLNCNLVPDDSPSLFQVVENLLRSEGAFLGIASTPDPDPSSFDKRLVFDSRIAGHDNRGHAFTDVLTAAERQAIIEYLKTL